MASAEAGPAALHQHPGPEGDLPRTQRARQDPSRLGLDPLPSTVARTSWLGAGRPHKDDVFAEGVRASSDWGSGQIEFARHMGIHRPCMRPAVGPELLSADALQALPAPTKLTFGKERVGGFKCLAGSPVS